jgi:tRNA threonylcarbamoyladenosine biosynthesis protein TsaE
METLHITNENELGGVAIIILGKLAIIASQGKTPVLAISGDLGAGKTTFMQQFAKELHIEEIVTSPTYVIMKRYEVPEDSVEIFKTLTHLDVYRIESIDEMRVLRFAELLQEPDAVICIEWAEKIKELLPEHTLYMEIQSTGEQSRTITFS